MLTFFFVLGIIYLIFGIDDLWIDLVAFFKRLGPKRIERGELRRLTRAEEKKIAIIVPAWKEGGVIGRMLSGNISHLKYKKYDFFVGVYPNDSHTVTDVQDIELQNPRVHAVINNKNGPSSKGQILNYVIESIFEYEKKTGVKFDAFLMQDSEDIIHPLVLKLVNRELCTFDFVQVPVFSLEVPFTELVAGTYVDEFAECHTKDILVRSQLGAAVPSAGVGTALSRELVDYLWQENGYLFNESSVTEDYELGNRAHLAGFSTHFSCYYYLKANGQKEYIATREYFPKRFSRSVRQKTRWTVGITLQAWKSLGWSGGFWNRYFLLRDRKALLCNTLGMLGYFALCFSFFTTEENIQELAYLNFGFLVLRFTQRNTAVIRVYGWKAALGIFLRWPLGNLINAIASVRAVDTYLVSQWKKTSIRWVKTEHELPQFFGMANVKGSTP